MMVGTSSLFAGEGKARETARAVDWSRSPLGPEAAWPTSLRTTLSILLNSRHPMFLWWGSELIQFYNDAYMPSFGRGKHPAAMGQPGVECWKEIWPIIYPQIEDVMERGKASWNEDQLVPIFRNGRIEEVYWTYGYSPVFDEKGNVGGVLVVCTETTGGVLAVRRLGFMRTLANALNHAEGCADVARILGECLKEASLDIPYAAITVEKSPAFLIGLRGDRPPELEPATSADPLAPRKLVTPIACQAWPEPVSEAVDIPFGPSPSGGLTFGLSPRLPFDSACRSFLQQVVEQVSTTRARIAVEMERRRLLQQAPVAAALLTGPDHVYTVANPRYIEMVGRDVLGKRYLDAFPEVRGTEVAQIVDRVFRTGEPYQTEEMLVPLSRADGSGLEEHYFNFSLEPVRDVAGTVYGMMVVAVDISAQVGARSALERTNQERENLLIAAEAASRAKDEFLAMLGHELRNPLAPIVTALEVMKAKKTPGLEYEREIIERQATHLVHLVDDLLDVSRVVQGKIELKKRRVSLSSIVGAATEMVGPLIRQRNHSLRVDVAAEGLEVDGDALRLGQIASNLLTNAARYTEPGGAISIVARGEGEHVVLRVEDSGIGLSKEQIPRLFERFFQGTRASDRAEGGLGLGLALVKSFAELHGGTVKVESAGLGKGSAFEVRLPRAVGNAPLEAAIVEKAASARKLPRQRVLLIDDSEDITELFSAFLTLSGFEVRTARDGPSGLRVAATFKPDVAVLDLGLPVMDGYQVAAKLIEQHGASSLRLIAMSGYGREDDIENTRRAGFADHLVKPVDGDVLVRAIARE